MARILKKSLLWMLPFVMVAVSCTKSGDPSSKSVSFSIDLASNGTRTSYSNDGTYTDGVLTKERIDWTNGDLVTVYSPEATKSDWTHYADYRIVSHTTSTDNLMSHGVVAPVESDGAGLTWEEGTNYFYGMYPSAKSFTSTDKGYGWIALDQTTLKGTIPAAQTLTWSGLTGTGNIKGTPDMRYAWMYATGSGEMEDEVVTLVFYPKFTAYEFTIGSGENDSVTLSSFKLETTETGGLLSGNFSMDGISGVVTPVSSTGTAAITVTFPEGTVVTPKKSLTFTVFTLPTNQTKMQITFTGTEIGERKLVLNGADGKPLSFTACKKYRLSGLRFPSILTAQGEDILWDLEAHGEGLEWY